MNLKLTPHKRQDRWESNLPCSFGKCRKPFKQVIQVEVDIEFVRNRKILPTRGEEGQKPWTTLHYPLCPDHLDPVVEAFRNKGFTVNVVPTTEVEGWIKAVETGEARAKKIIGERLRPYIKPPPETTPIRGEKG